MATARAAHPRQTAMSSKATQLSAIERKIDIAMGKFNFFASLVPTLRKDMSSAAYMRNQLKLNKYGMRIEHLHELLDAIEQDMPPPLAALPSMPR